MNVFQKFLLFVVKPFYGKGYVDKYFPFLIGYYSIFASVTLDDFITETGVYTNVINIEICNL